MPIRTLISAVCLAVLAACGGGGAGVDANTATTVVSSARFPIRSAYESITGNTLAVTLTGSDNAPGVVLADQMVLGGKYVSREDYLKWTGYITVAQRASSGTAGQGQVAYAVDYNVLLRRLRDGTEFRDAITVYFSADARPLAMTSYHGYLAVWDLPVAPLPAEGPIGTSSGVSNAQVCAYTTGLQCASTSPSTSVGLSAWGLMPDTAETGSLNLLYKSQLAGSFDNTSPVISQPTDVVAPTQENTTVEIGIKIDATGKYRGITYKRTEKLLTIAMSGV